MGYYWLWIWVLNEQIKFPRGSLVWAATAHHQMQATHLTTRPSQKQPESSINPISGCPVKPCSKQKTITPQLFAEIVEIFPVVEIDKIQQDAYSSHLSLLRQQNFWSTQREFPLRFEKSVSRIKKQKLSKRKQNKLFKKQITDKCECLMVSHCDKNRQEDWWWFKLFKLFVDCLVSFFEADQNKVS